MIPPSLAIKVLPSWYPSGATHRLRAKIGSKPQADEWQSRQGASWQVCQATLNMANSITPFPGNLSFIWPLSINLKSPFLRNILAKR